MRIHTAAIIHAAAMLLCVEAATAQQQVPYIRATGSITNGALLEFSGNDGRRARAVTNLLEKIEQAGGLTNETDPVFAISTAANIDGSATQRWETAYSWGDHAGLYDTVGATEALSNALGSAAFTDSVAFATKAQGALADSAWQPGDSVTNAADEQARAYTNDAHTAYSWGNHSEYGYLQMSGGTMSGDLDGGANHATNFMGIGYRAWEESYDVDLSEGGLYSSGESTLSWGDRVLHGTWKVDALGPHDMEKGSFSITGDMDLGGNSITNIQTIEPARIVLGGVTNTAWPSEGGGGGDWYTNAPTGGAAINIATNPYTSGTMVLAQTSSNTFALIPTTTSTFHGFNAYSTNGNLTLSGTTTLVHDKEEYDTDDLHDTSTGGFTPHADGVWRIGGYCAANSTITAGKRWILNIYQDSAFFKSLGITPGDGTYPGVNGSVDAFCTSTNTYTLTITTDDTGTEVAARNRSGFFFYATYLGSLQ